MTLASRTAIVYGLTGQTLSFTPPEYELRRFGPPTGAATYAVWRGVDSNDQSSMFSGTATLDSVSTTVSSASGTSQANRRKLSLTSVSGISANASYAVANAVGEREIVTPYEVDSGYLLLGNELAFDYPISTSTLKGIAHTFTVDPTFVNTVSNINAYGTLFYRSQFLYATTNGNAPPYRVRWVYATGDGVTRYAWTYFDLVRQNTKHNVTVADLRAVFPDISDREWREQRGQQFAAQLDAAWELVRWDVEAKGVPIDQVRDQWHLDELVRSAALMVIAEAGIVPGGRDTEPWVKERQDKYRARIDAVPQVLRVDVSTTGAIHPDPPRQMRLRR